MDYLEAERFIKSHDCAKCGGELSYRHLGAGECEIICPGNPDHKEFRPQASLTELWHRGETLPLYIKQNLDKKYGGDPVEKRQSLALKKVDQLVPDLEQLWPDLVRKKNIALQMAQVAILHGLDPFTGEIMLYQGQMAIAHKAKMRKAYDTGKLESLETREATEQEYKERGWTQEETKHGWVAIIEREGLKKPIKGYGRVTWKEYRYAEKKEAEKERERGEDRPTFLWLLREPADMAEKRAIDDALRKAFPDSIVLTLPSLETIEGEFMEIKGEETEGAEKETVPGFAEALSRDNRLILWNNIRDVLGRLKFEREDDLTKWFFDHYRVQVSLETFNQDLPPDELSEKILAHFRDALLVYEENLKAKTKQAHLPLGQTSHVDEALATAWQAAKAELLRGRLTAKELTEYFKNNHHITVTHRDFLQEWPSSKFNTQMLSRFVDWCHSRGQS